MEQMGIFPPMATCCESIPRPLLGAGLDPTPWDRPEVPVANGAEPPLAVPLAAQGPPPPGLGLAATCGPARTADDGFGAVGGGTLADIGGIGLPADDDTKDEGRDEAGLMTGEYDMGAAGGGK